jgi:hypothetical protein
MVSRIPSIGRLVSCPCRTFAGPAAGRIRLESVCLPTAKDKMVRDFYRRMGFTLTAESAAKREFELRLEAFQPVPTKIKIVRRAYEPG